MKFKEGDRVLLVKNYSYYPNVGLTGIVIRGEFNKYENTYQVRWDNGTEDEDFETFEGELRKLTKLEIALK